MPCDKTLSEKIKQKKIKISCQETTRPLSRRIFALLRNIPVLLQDKTCSKHFSESRRLSAHLKPIEKIKTGNLILHFLAQITRIADFAKKKKNHVKTFELRHTFLRIGSGNQIYLFLRPCAKVAFFA